MALLQHGEFTGKIMKIKDQLDEIIKLSANGVNRKAGSLAAVIMDDISTQVKPVTVVQSSDNLVKEQTWPDTVENSGYIFGRKSIAELAGVFPVMTDMAKLALKYSRQDFMVYDGVRMIEEQKRNVANGSSKTMNSKHLPQADGFSHAIDLVPVVQGIPKWDWQLIYFVAVAVDRAATEMKIANRIRWGGVWDRTLADFGGSAKSYQQEVEAYAKRHPGKDFLDGPHFEWIA